ncbi:tRNA pseudouridine(55) synthase TruB [Agromyces seonyuensis]|uniref:tRNA pseudouridine synthase B n=1 Tax=Agromyces seonyuensis TaxID=2662446 RepID=A0A6I4P7J5_9MICO|nr:tRNA pseudouridine(55) synthase TruB [Agromyces seonyuensis]MWB99757.1 tRNA pseudouridine(55) synthase TruB [Agromyces seonyuensis]
MDPVNSGILLIDKPHGRTSHDVVARVRRAAGTRKVGHAGTLDPMATGLLVIGVESATRLLTHLVGLDKEYTATIRLGVAMTTDDAEGEAIGEPAAADALAAVDDAALTGGIAALTGVIEQVPSAVSAIKVDGKRAYDRVRAGEEVELKSRTVTISAFEVLGAPRRTDDGFLDLDVRVECSSGTYIRALARDLGAGLGVGGHLTALRRTRVGAFRIEEAVLLDDLEPDRDRIAPAAAARRILPVVEVDADGARDLGHGKRIDAPADAPEGPIAAIEATADGERLVAIVERRGPVGARAFKVVTGFPT